MPIGRDVDLVQCVRSLSVGPLTQPGDQPQQRALARVECGHPWFLTCPHRHTRRDRRQLVPDRLKSLDEHGTQ